MSDIDYTRPLLLAYVRRDLFITDRQVAHLKQQLTEFARIEAFAMGSLYVENPETAPAVFEALVTSVNRYEVTAVVLPGLRHLALVGDPELVKRQFERVTGARIMLHKATP